MLRWRGKEWVEDEDRKTTDTDREEEEEEEGGKDETERKAAKKTRRMKGEEEGCGHGQLLRKTELWEGWIDGGFGRAGGGQKRRAPQSQINRSLAARRHRVHLSPWQRHLLPYRRKMKGFLANTKNRCHQ